MANTSGKLDFDDTWAPNEETHVTFLTGSSRREGLFRSRRKTRAQIEPRLEQPRRWWLMVGLALLAMKFAITGLWILQGHHMASIPAHAVDETLWWMTKISPPLAVAAFAMDARQKGNRVYERFFMMLLLITVVYGTIVTYAMLHGWKGTPI